MPWLALALEVDGAHAEALADALLELGAQSVAAEDAGTDGEWRRQRLSALVGLETDAAALVTAAAQAIGLAAPPGFGERRVEDADWVRASQAQFGPQRAGERLWVVPSWCAAPAEEGALVLRLDPGLAFGTGSHPSTRLVLAWLERNVRAGDHVLDYGCGSGILALAAARLGAARVAAVDIDPQALDVCAANARANGHALEISAPDALAAQPFDVIVANILARPLIELAPRIGALARAGARLALAGILEPQAAEVAAAYESAFALAVAGREEGWALVAGVRR